MESSALDVIDRAILAVIRDRARISWRELGDEVGLGATSTADRVRRLEQLGVISGYSTTIDPGALGMRLRAIVELKLAHGRDEREFEALLAATPEVQTAFHVTGGYDYLLLVACDEVATLDALLRGWKRDHGVLESSTRIVLADIDLTTH